MPKPVLVLAVLLLYVLHQDFWFWRDSRLVFGVLPIGLFYHAVYCLACAALMWALVRFAWPVGLDSETDQQPATNNQQPK